MTRLVLKAIDGEHTVDRYFGSYTEAKIEYLYYVVTYPALDWELWDMTEAQPVKLWSVVRARP
jgi:hypothetical protein